MAVKSSGDALWEVRGSGGAGKTRKRDSSQNTFSVVMIWTEGGQAVALKTIVGFSNFPILTISFSQ